MARIFISHNSQDAKEAAALKRWLTDNGWDDTFLDIDAKDGLSPGERWKDALKNAADRCEAVLCLVSPTWLASAECKLEFRYAEQLRKHLFLALIKPCNTQDLPPDWQWCPLYGDGAQTTIRFNFREQPTECTFLSDGLERLKNGLRKAGISAEHFPWPLNNDPDRAPYRGLKPLEAADAAVFFGRNAQTLHGMETLWEMRRNGIERLLVILGASGSGKSSFMRAGLLPRLARDDRQFYPLPVIRPRNAVLSGAEGLASALAAAFGQVGGKITLGEIEKRLNAGSEAFDKLLRELEQYLLDRTVGETDQQAPSIVIPIDQAEELFNPDGIAEAELFLTLLAGLLADSDAVAASGVPSGPRGRILVVLTIRSDRYERLQTAPRLSGIKPRLFDLRPFPPGQFERVINGPAERVTQAGRKLTIDSRLTERLLTDFSEGADTLPLLGFALEKLYHKYGSDGDLTLEDYEAIRGSHETVQAAIFQEAIDTALQEPYRPPVISTERTEQYQGLRRAFIPFLARINPVNNEPMRQVAKLAALPADIRPLVERLVEARLLIRDKDAIEVAHESLLRQWPNLRGWLAEDLDKLRLLETIRHSAAEWKKEGERKDLLVHRNGRLKDAEALLANPHFTMPEASVERAYLDACSAAQQAREAAEKEEQERRIRDAERIAEEQKKAAEAQKKTAEKQKTIARRTLVGLVATLVLSAIAGIAALHAYRNGELARQEAQRAKEALVQAEAERLLQRRLIQLARNRDFPTPPYAIDTLARRYEGQAPDHVGSDFSGAVYYGTYRIKAGPNMEAFLGFLRRYHPVYHQKIAKAGGAEGAARKSIEFVSAWQSLANDGETGGTFSLLQKDYVEQFNYKRLAARLAASSPQGSSPADGPLHLVVGSRSFALRAVLFSIANQYGPGTQLPFDALRNQGDLRKKTDAEIIEQLYLFRDDVARYFPDIKSENFVELIKERNQWEKLDALYMLKQEGR